MEKETIKLPCNITGKMFAGFAMYDTFVRRRGWRPPTVFVILMSGFAAVCFTVLGDREQASLLGTVLLAVGLVLPVIWVLMYIVSVRGQIKKFGLSEKKTQYTVELDEKRICVSNGRETADYEWGADCKIVERAQCAYLYVGKARAFILPKTDKWDDILSIAEKTLGKDKINLYKGRRTL